MRKILAPHKEQDGFVYIRAEAKPSPNGGVLFPRWADNWRKKSARVAEWLWYSDKRPHHRVISSRRVEEAVETADWMRRCEAEDLGYQRMRHHDKWLWYVFSNGVGAGRHGATIREAYHRFHASKQVTP